MAEPAETDTPVGQASSRKPERIEHDTFRRDGSWAPPGGDELLFHSGFSEPSFGLERDGLGASNDATVLRAAVRLSVLARRLEDLPSDERGHREFELARAAIQEILTAS